MHCKYFWTTELYRTHIERWKYLSNEAENLNCFFSPFCPFFHEIYYWTYIGFLPNETRTNSIKQLPFQASHCTLYLLKMFCVLNHLPRKSMQRVFEYDNMDISKNMSFGLLWRLFSTSIHVTFGSIVPFPHHTFQFLCSKIFQNGPKAWNEKTKETSNLLTYLAQIIKTRVPRSFFKVLY